MSKRGWCPNLYEPMQAGDGLLVRVKPPGGVVPADAAMALAGASERFGNGIAALTNRANLQFRGLSAASAQAFADVVLTLGLASADASVERRRNVIVAPLDPAAERLGAEIAAMLAEPAFAGLPGKFGIVADGGRHSVAAAPGDILLQPHGDLVRIVAGGMAAQTREPLAALRQMIQAMLASGGVRMREVRATAVFAAAGLMAVPHHAAPARPAVIGRLADAYGVGLAFGQTGAEGLRRLARLATSGDGTLRLTPWRAVLLPGVTHAALDHADLITGPGSPLTGIDACPGRPACAQASVDTRRDARLLAGLMPGLHVSGCTKGCARAGPSAVTLVGAGGRYNLVRNGGAGDTPVLSGLTVAEIAGYLTAGMPG